ncbi:MAG: hypothetical protein SGI83_12930 [Bacteroidota bacterium]|nr:hypothetical protein [Bacteroidota bacterium]
MQTGRIIQGVILMMIVAMAASCAASKEYSSKLFSPRVPLAKDSHSLAATLRFLNIDSVDTDKEGWVTTDIIMGRDTVNTVALDKLATTYPAALTAKDTVTKNIASKAPIVITDVKTTPVESAPVAKNANPGEVRNKKIRE